MAAMETTSSSPGNDLEGRVAIVTGGSSGLGFEAALALATRGAHVVLTSRSQVRGEEAAVEIASRAAKQAGPSWGGKVECMQLDLASFSSIHAFASRFLATSLPLHMLLANAGQFMTPFTRTHEGFEATVGIKHFGHHLLMQLLAEKMADSAPARVVFMSGSAERGASVDWDDLSGLKVKDSGMGQAARANLFAIMQASEWNRRLKNSGITVLACHPGLARTDFASKMDASTLWTRVFMWLVTLLTRVIGLSAAEGALPMVYAATAPELQGTDFSYWGPGPRGGVTLSKPENKSARDAVLCKRLFNRTEMLVAGAKKNE